VSFVAVGKDYLAGGGLHHFGIATRDRSDDTKLLLLLDPAMRQRAAERGDGEFGWRAAVDNGLDDARRRYRNPQSG
jgi:hypothetical protein